MTRLMKYLKTRLYDKMPPLASCHMCGECCVNVTLTMIEFIYMFSSLCKRYPQEKLISILQKPLKRHPHLINQYTCRFLNDDASCLAYKERAFSCRAGGNYCLDKIFIHNCLKRDFSNEKSPFTVEEYWNMMIKLEMMDDTLREFKNTLFLSRIALESWISIYLDENIQNKEIQKIQLILKKNLNLDFLKGNYIDKINFSKQVNLVEKAKHNMEQNNYGEALKTYKTIISKNFDGYYLDEAYYYAGICSEKMGNELEAILYLKKISNFHPYYQSASIHLQNILKSSRSLLSAFGLN